MSRDESRLLSETLAAALTPLQPSPEARAQWLARLRGEERFSLFGAELARIFDVTLSDALVALRLIHDPRAWLPSAQPGWRWFTTPALRERGAVIARLPPGIRLPRHTHAARELTFVLDGLLLENGCARRGAGALLNMPVGSEHEVQVSDDEHCLVVFANR